MKRILSGVQPSGLPHIGNYFGAMKPNIEFQKSHEAFLMIADLHSLTTMKDPVALKNNIISLALDYLALGVDPKKAIFFRQSQVPAHSELAWILSCIAPFGLLERAHAWKDTLEKGLKEKTVGLFTYPVLMSADILLYKPELVPVGKDQKQHIEIARDLAVKFNSMYGDTFPLPECYTPKEVEVIPGTDGQKMSKSYGNTIDLFTDEKTIKKQVMSIVTDSRGVDEPKDPNTCNVFALLKLFLNKTEQAELTNKYCSGGIGYGDAKKMLLERILETFRPYRAKRIELENNLDYIEKCLKEGASKASQVANTTLEEIKKKVGL